MLYIRLAGGLGNQVFQLAAAMALRDARQERVLFGVRALGRYRAARALELTHFFDLPGWFETCDACGAHGRIAEAVLRTRVGRLAPILGVSDRSFAARVVSRRRSFRVALVDGYFQRDWPTETFDATRRGLMQMTVPGLSGSDGSGNYDCVLHIRGGDFLQSPHSNVVGRSFYERAVHALRETMDIRRIYVVTDDPAYARSELVALAKGLADLELVIPDAATDMLSDFATIRHARCRIIGNSTFSWWAAALDPREAPTVAPMQWLRGLDRTLVLPWERLLAID